MDFFCYHTFTWFFFTMFDFLLYFIICHQIQIINFSSCSIFKLSMNRRRSCFNFLRTLIMRLGRFYFCLNELFGLLLRIYFQSRNCNDDLSIISTISFYIDWFIIDLIIWIYFQSFCQKRTYVIHLISFEKLFTIEILTLSLLILWLPFCCNYYSPL